MTFNFSRFVLRMALAMTFIFHGSGILFNWFDGPGVYQFSIHMHMPLIIAILVGVAEFTGGLAMLTGILTRVGAINIMLVMFGAIMIVHLPHGFDLQKGGMEYALTEFLIALSIFISGPGSFTVLSIFCKKGIPFMLE
jgi:putative oxidoreductase